MKYTYKDFKDKSVEGIKKELQEGLTKATVYFYQTHGMYLDAFNEQLEKMDIPEQLNWYMNFRNTNQKVYK